MFKIVSQWWQRRLIQQSNVSEDAWSSAFARLPLLRRLTNKEKIRLQETAILLLHKKSFLGAHDLEVTEEMKLIIALQACLPILNLSIGWYRGWHSIIIYPAGFRPDHTYTDEAGVVHHEKRALSGEAWSRGPVILSWDEVKDAGIIDGENLVIHEFAHKLDMRNGIANGFPPLHKGMNKKQWAEVFTEAYDDLHYRLQNGQRSEIDSYAAHSPAEFFSVLSELFFERPGVIDTEYPDVYKLLSEFYKQDTLAKIT
ncbi:MAG TPA: zinc-dependent peptidase [Chromatiales bacterium]|nr:zinc-dependent peptidase [Thiotrichales bacterium]HIP67369.1 zinc-dependent peptidase [Chromatiales bacterium]